MDEAQRTREFRHVSNLNSAKRAPAGQQSQRADIPGWQATAGNQAVQRYLNSGPAQMNLLASDQMQTPADLLLGWGEPLSGPVRAFFESRFNHDFGNVRVHIDREAAKSAEALQATAYAVGSHIVFGEGQYAPDTLGGKKLIAHELTHILQQGGPVQSDASSTVSNDVVRRQMSGGEKGTQRLSGRSYSDFELLLLGRNPQAAHQAWGSLDPDQRETVLSYMGQLHGIDFAAEFSSWLGRAEPVHDYDSIRNPFMPPSRLAAMGFRVWTFEYPYQLWVHPNGRIMHYKVIFLDSQTKDKSQTKDPESGGDEAENLDPILMEATDYADHLAAWWNAILAEADALRGKVSNPEYARRWCEIRVQTIKIPGFNWRIQRKFPAWDEGIDEANRVKLEEQKQRILDFDDVTDEKLHRLWDGLPSPQESFDPGCEELLGMRIEYSEEEAPPEYE